MIKKTAFLTSVSAMILISGSSIASDKMSMDEVQAQLKQLSAQVQTLSNIVEQQNQVIKQQQKDLDIQKQSSNEAIANIKSSTNSNNMGDVKISMKPMPKIESLDGKYSFQPFGRAHLDVTAFDDDKKDHASNANFRRARLGFKGKLGEDLAYKTEFEFAEENVNLKEVSITYSGLDFADIKIGNQKPSFGMENNTSSNYMMFIERTAPSNAFARSQEIGLNILGGGDNWSFAAGVFNEDAGNNDTGEDEDITYDFRGSANIFGLAKSDTDNILHIGAGYSHRRPTGDISFSAKPAGDGDDIIDTASISFVDSVNLYNAELAAVLGSVSFQGEYFMADVSRSNGNSDASFDGFYGQAGWFITGESRGYKGKTGNFTRVKPNSPFSLENGGTGAWEVLARYENTNLNDTGAGIMGGELESVSLGVNWHLNDHVRLMANVIDVNTDNNAVVANDDPTIYNMRAQWDF